MCIRDRPKSAFQSMGVSKKDFIRLSKSMAELNFMESAATLYCPTLSLCGAKDKTNMESAKPVSYTHLDVYKRQMSLYARCC